jgi:5-carboxymethyl-2-hydroxymuconate isomerase
MQGVHVPEDATYDDFVRVSKEIMRGRSTDEQRTVVRQVLQSLMPEQAPGVFR